MLAKQIGYQLFDILYQTTFINSFINGSHCGLIFYINIMARSPYLHFILKMKFMSSINDGLF